MSAAALIREAQESGIKLRLVNGKIKAIGPREAVARLLVPLREHRAALADALQSEPAEPSPSVQADTNPEPTDWRALAAAYHAHHFNCATCIAAGRGRQYGLRCGDRGSIVAGVHDSIGTPKAGGNIPSQITQKPPNRKANCASETSVSYPCTAFCQLSFVKRLAVDSR